MENQNPPLSAKDPNLLIATVRPVSKLAPPKSAVSKLKLPQPSKLKAPVNTIKRPRPTANDNQIVNQSKRSRIEAVPKPVQANNLKASKRPNNVTRRTTQPKASARPAVTKPATGRVATSQTNRTTGSRTAVSSSTKTNPTATSSKASKAKRPAWDIKGRLEDMEKEMKGRVMLNINLEDRINTNNGRIQQLENLNTQLKGTVAQKELLTTEASETIRQLKRKLEDLEDEIATSTRRFQQKLDDASQSYTTLQRKHVVLEGELAASTQECAGLKSTVAHMTSSQAGMQAQLSSTQMNLQMALEAGTLKDEEIAQLKQIIAEHEATIKEKDSKIREDEGVRRKLHNTIQELKGNIRVFCRVRPLLGDECSNGETIQHLGYPDEDGKVLEMEKLNEAGPNESCVNTRRNGTGKYEFIFDRVFTPTSKQEDVFDEISQLVQSCLDGYNVCIFAYGQTGSGKTYTMEGPDDPDDVTIGMIPRAVEQVFVTAQQLQDKGWEYDMESYFVEIYNETIRDLLGSPNSKTKHDIKMVDAKSSEVEVTNLTKPKVTLASQVTELLKTASHNRAVAATNCNERSSRSHSVFRLKLSGKNKLTGETCQGTLNLVDLAGSERLSQSGSTGERLRETKSINKSLSNLGNVIMALGNKDSHIPYRNSKLTHMLQDSLGGNSKTLMFVNVSPKEDNFQESLCSLRFATKVNQCNIGTAQKKVK